MATESRAAKQARAKKILDLLARAYPEAKIALEFRTPFELLVATILSAQCTDERVNMVTPALFRKYPTARELARARTPSLEKEIRSTGFFRAKARSLLGMSKTLVERHGGEDTGGVQVRVVHVAHRDALEQPPEQGDVDAGAGTDLQRGASSVGGQPRQPPGDPVAPGAVQPPARRIARLVERALEREQFLVAAHASGLTRGGRARGLEARPSCAATGTGCAPGRPGTPASAPGTCAGRA